jgi:hypothetical protein
LLVAVVAADRISTTLVAVAVQAVVLAVGLLITVLEEREVDRVL